MESGLERIEVVEGSAQSMFYDKRFYGVYADLRCVTPDDAEATLKMRLDSDKARFLHPVENNLEKQRDWIKKQIEREGDYYFLALSKKDEPIGTFSIYDIVGDECRSGRLIMFGNALQSFEINLMTFKFAFEYLGLSKILGDVDEKNVTAIRFAEMFGCRFEDAIPDTDLDRMVRFCSLTKDDFYKKSPDIEKKIYRGKTAPVMPWENKVL